MTEKRTYNRLCNFKTDFVFDESTSSSAKVINRGKSVEDSLWKCGPPQAYGAYVADALVYTLRV